MESYKFDDLEITVGRRGADRFQKMSFPIRYGRFCEVKTPQYLFEFNLNAEIKYIRGLGRSWPHPAEWLKRTDANDWVFYSTGGYAGVIDVLGEYYRPCLPYPSNSVWEYNPFADTSVQQAVDAHTQLVQYLRVIPPNGMPAEVKKFITLAADRTAEALDKKSKKLHQIIGGRVAVLPPDTRYVDYNVIPVMVADGCLYRCGFCSFKSRQPFRARSKENVLQQIQHLQTFYGPDLANYNAVFLGNHDALAAGEALIGMAATEAATAFDLESSLVKKPALFMFASADSFLNTGEWFLRKLNRLPLNTYINIGFESADQATLAQLNKPLDVQKIKDAFDKMLAVNQSYAGIEVTANFLIGDRLPEVHYDAVIELLRYGLNRNYSKGAIYLSPLKNSRNHPKLMKRFAEIKKLSRLPVFLYLIQRL